MPWRDTRDPWAVLVSEFMLQQTQVSRVMKSYPEWMRRWPDPVSMASAALPDVLCAWSGLGYNRRALNLVRTAKTLVERYGGLVPCDRRALESLPGVGTYTASAVLAFAFGVETILIETNVRAAFIHHFFRDRSAVSDATLVPLVREAAEGQDPRIWNYALMDYGAGIKRRFANPTRRSASYTPQSPFKGSNRQVRGGVLRALSDRVARGADELSRILDMPMERVEGAIRELEAEGFVESTGGCYALAGSGPPPDRSGVLRGALRTERGRGA